MVLKMKIIIKIGLLFLSISSSCGILRRGLFRNKPVGVSGNDDPGQPLFLTPLIKTGDLDKARLLSQVALDGYNLTSYSGYLTVNDTYGSNMFFWFFPAQSGDPTAPVLLWLQGGPGGTSMFGLFVEHGPFNVDANNNLIPREWTWNKKYSMLYIDNPVGTGFSFTNSDAGYSKNEDDVAANLYSALTQFFTLFNEYQPNDFYATGESYAGKYVPAISLKIHEENQMSPQVKINLKGLLVGDGLCDPESMMAAYAPFMFNTGLLDENQRDFFSNYSYLAIQFIKAGEFKDAFNIFDYLLNGDLTGYKPWFYNQTGLDFYYNYLLATAPKDFDYFNNFLALATVRKSIHVGNLTFNDGTTVEKMIVNDIMDSVKMRVATLLDADYKVLMYSGVLDIIVALPLTEGFLQVVPWKGLDGYKAAPRSIWKLNPDDVDVAGYVRTYANLAQVSVRGGGHILPYDQPERSFQMVDGFITYFNP